MAPGAAMADRGGTAIGTLAYQRRPEAAALPVRLAPRPLVLAGCEELLTEIDARLAPLPPFRARQADLLARGEAPGHREHTATTLGMALSRLPG